MSRDKKAQMALFEDTLRKIAEVYRPVAALANTLERIKAFTAAAMPFDEGAAAHLKPK
jgi:hypothetical protein